MLAKIISTITVFALVSFIFYWSLETTVIIEPITFLQSIAFLLTIYSSAISFVILFLLIARKLWR